MKRRNAKQKEQLLKKLELILATEKSHLLVG